MRRLSLSLALLMLLAAPALAEEAQPVQDFVTTDLRAETWVTAQRALVQVSIIAAGKATDAATIRNDLVKVLKDLAKDADWRPTSLNRSQDQTGFDRWDAVYEARLPESALAGLADKAKSLSRAGLQVMINNVQFTPELAEVEAARAKLRAELLAKTNEELAKLNSTLQGRKFRISQISFGGMGGMPMPQMYAMAKQARGMEMAMDAQVANMAMAGAPAGMDMSVQTKLELTAIVTFASFPEKEVAK